MNRKSSDTIVVIAISVIVFVVLQFIEPMPAFRITGVNTGIPLDLFAVIMFIFGVLKLAYDYLKRKIKLAHQLIF